MPRFDFNDQEEITDEQLEYLLSEATALSQQDDLYIENYSDREALNPDVDEISADDIDDDEAEDEPLVVGFHEVMLFGRSRKRRFRKIKRKVRQFFCRTIGDLGGGDGLDLKELLKSALIAIIPAFGGVPAVVSVIVISLLALYMKRGYKRVCPA